MLMKLRSAPSSRKTPGPQRERSVLARLHQLALNLRWTWSPDAQRLFASLDQQLWQAVHRNPIVTMKVLPPERREMLDGDERFDEQLDACERDLERYLSSRTWFQRTQRTSPAKQQPLVAYLCFEFAIHESLPIYSGGLGVLAGDHVKSASDLGVPLVAVGLLYRRGYYTQQFNRDGSTRVIYPRLDFSELPIEDTGKAIEVPIGRAKIRAKIWRAQVGRCPIYLLDTDVEPNKPVDRELTAHLYGGDREYRIRQEMLLGVGGVLALSAVGLSPTVFHLNEGHAAFCTLERLRARRKRGMSLDDALAFIHATTVFTTHTPVPAGNDRFAPQLAMKYLAPLAGQIGLSRDQLLALGREDPTDRSEDFTMTVLALRLAEHCNGVAELHGETSRRMWTRVFDVRDPDEVPIGHITNGVHSETWLAPEIRPLYDRYLKPKWLGAGPADDWWRRAHRIPPDELWAARNMLRARLIRFIRNRLADQIARRNGSVEELAQAHEMFDDDVLTIGFARRFATYKRAPLVFRDANRLAKILGHPKRAVQIVFAGKAHPQDRGGQSFAQQIFKHANEPRFSGRVLILEGYDTEVGRMLTSGCDVWLNNPLRPQEASGTSGMKPPLHGGINCSVLDGWWPEAFNGTNGWAINGRQFKEQSKQDKHDADQIYRLLERQIVPAFYDRDRAGLPRRWIGMMVESMKSVCGHFNTHRMVGEYWAKYYSEAHRAALTPSPSGRGPG